MNLKERIEAGRVIGPAGDTALAATGEPFRTVTVGLMMGGALDEGAADAILDNAAMACVGTMFDSGGTVYWRFKPRYETERPDRPRRNVYLRLLISDKPAETL